MKHILEADGIELSFGNRRILSSIYIKVETGKITGLLARNGEGKTSLMNIIYRSFKGQSCSIRVDDKSIFKAYNQPQIVNYLPQFNFIPTSLTLQQAFQDFELDFKSFTAYFDIIGQTGKTKH